MRTLRDEQRLRIPDDVLSDEVSFELITVWYSNGKVKVLTRDGTPLDQRLEIWAEIVNGIIENIADHACGYDATVRADVEKRIAVLVLDKLNRRT